MSGSAMHQNAFASYEEMQAQRFQAPVFCPKPRRLHHLAVAVSADVDRSRIRLEPSPDPFYSEAGADLLDIFLSKGGGEKNQVASSPPFFTGSPPTRSSNPLVHDARFREEKPVYAFSPGPAHPQPAGSPLSPSRKGCGPAKFGFKPAAVRVEGFNCLDRRGRPSRGITAVA